MSFNQLIQKYTVRHDRKIKQTCEPLKNYLGMEYFSYYSINNDGRFVFLSNFPEQVEYFFAQDLHLSCPYYVHPNYLKSGVILDSPTPDAFHQEKITAKYSMSNILILIEKEEECVKTYLFSNPSEEGKEDLNPHLSNNDLKLKFGRYFAQEHAALIAQIADEGYSLKECKGKRFFESPAKMEEQNKVDQFLKAISPLTPRERECLELFKKGYSAQATAVYLGISRRTVEYHFDNIKTKLNCSSKWHLLDK